MRTSYLRKIIMFALISIFAVGLAACNVAGSSSELGESEINTGSGVYNLAAAETGLVIDYEGRKASYAVNGNPATGSMLTMTADGSGLQMDTVNTAVSWPGINLTLPYALVQGVSYRISFNVNLVSSTGSFPMNFWVQQGSSNFSASLTGTGSYNIEKKLTGTGTNVLQFFLQPELLKCKFILSNVRIYRGPGFVNQRDKNFYGVGEMFATNPLVSQGPSDKGVTPQIVTELAGALGMKTYRMWMHAGPELLQRGVNDNSLTLIASKVAQHKKNIQLLKDQGITNIVSMSHYFNYPVGFNYNGDTLGVYPAPGSASYEPFMAMIEESYYILAQAFPEIKYWECGNEINWDNYCRPTSGTYTIQQKAQITTDLMYFASKGMKRGNSEAVAVMAGLVFNGDPNYGTPKFLQLVYGNIKSGNYPSVSTVKSTKNDDYFDVLNWHPYNWSGQSGADSDFVKLNNAIYKVAQDNGDDGKKVIFTEFGYTTTQDTYYNRDFWESRQENYLAADYANIYNNLPYVESVILFRMFDWENGGVITGNPDTIEIGYGLFKSPLSSTGIVPKKCIVKLYQYIKGANADLSPLYQFSNTIMIDSQANVAKFKADWGGGNVSLYNGALVYDTAGTSMPWPGAVLTLPYALEQGASYRITYDIDIKVNSATMPATLWTQQGSSNFSTSINNLGYMHITNTITGTGSNTLQIFLGTSSAQFKFIIDNVRITKI